MHIVTKLVEQFKMLFEDSTGKPCPYVHEPLRIWTRGDGIRYKDFAYVSADLETATNLFRVLDSHKNSKKLWISGEFGSSPYHPAVVHKGLVISVTSVLGEQARVEFGAATRLKNTDVWRSYDRNVTKGKQT